MFHHVSQYLSNAGRCEVAGVEAHREERLALRSRRTLREELVGARREGDFGDVVPLHLRHELLLPLALLLHRHGQRLSHLGNCVLLGVSFIVEDRKTLPRD